MNSYFKINSVDTNKSMSPQVNGTEARVYGTQVQPRTPILMLPPLRVCLLTTIQFSTQEIQYT